MTLGAHPDKIAAWCGTWYDYLRPGTGCRCNTSVLFPSAELIEQHRQMGATPAQLAAMGRHDERRRDDTYIEALATELAEVLGDGVRRSLGGLPLM
ncbi:MAG: hypothetical protein H0W01_09550 [Pseudonocardiales bacterium]|nr:hypothetical protein [Pseudonocardiales bacterium]